jgi:hypothetical protein
VTREELEGALREAGASFETFGMDGMCPVQCDGRIDGHAFYFRARGERVSLSVTHGPARERFNLDAVDVSIGRAPGFHLEAWHGPWPEAGYLEQEEAWAYLLRGLIAWKWLRTHDPDSRALWLGTFAESADAPMPPEVLKARMSMMLCMQSEAAVEQVRAALGRLRALAPPADSLAMFQLGGPTVPMKEVEREVETIEARLALLQTGCEAVRGKADE